MTNVLFDRQSLKVTGLNRPALPFEVEVTNVPLEGLTKEGTYTEAEPTGLYSLPQAPIEVAIPTTRRVKTSEASDEPALRKEVVKIPLLDEAGHQVRYEVTSVAITPAVLDEFGAVLEEETQTNVGTGVYRDCYTSEVQEIQEEDIHGNILYWHTIEGTEKRLEARPDIEITKEDPNYVEGLEELTADVQKTKTVTFEEAQDEFTFEDIVKHKESKLIDGTLYWKATLFEEPASVIDSGLASFQADLGFGVVSLPAGGEARTVKLTLPVSTDIVGIHFEANPGLVVSIGRLASSFTPMNKRGAVYLDQPSSEVYVLFENPTDKRIDLTSFAILV